MTKVKDNNQSGTINILFKNYCNNQVKPQDKDELWETILYLLKNEKEENLIKSFSFVDSHSDKTETLYFHRTFMELSHRLNKEKKDQLFEALSLSAKNNYIKKYLLNAQVINYNFFNFTESSGHLVYLVNMAEKYKSNWKDTKFKLLEELNYYGSNPKVRNPLIAFLSCKEEIATEKFIKMINFLKSKKIGFNTSIERVTPLDAFLNTRTYVNKTNIKEITQQLEHLIKNGCNPNKLEEPKSAYSSLFPVVLKAVENKKKEQKGRKDTPPSNMVLFLGYFLYSNKHYDWLEKEPQKTKKIFLNVYKKDRKKFDISRFYLMSDEKKQEFKIIVEKIELEKEINVREPKKKIKIL